MKNCTAVLIGLIFLGISVTAQAAGIVPAPGTRLNVKVKTFLDLRFSNMVKQNYDVSCGAAALSTILSYYYDREVSEQQVMDAIIKTASEEDKENIAKYGFSMLELKRAGEDFGFLSAGFKLVGVENLTGLEVPAITLINTRGYNHFVVVKGVSRGRVQIADPAFGNRTRTLSRFSGEWNNVVLVFVDPDNPGTSNFSTAGSPEGRAQDVIPMLNQGLRTVIARPANEY